MRDHSDLQGTNLYRYYVRVGGPLPVVLSMWWKPKIYLRILIFSIITYFKIIKLKFLQGHGKRLKLDRKNDLGHFLKLDIFITLAAFSSSRLGGQSGVAKSLVLKLCWVECKLPLYSHLSLPCTINWLKQFLRPYKWSREIQSYYVSRKKAWTILVNIDNV